MPLVFLKNMLNGTRILPGCRTIIHSALVIVSILCVTDSYAQSVKQLDRPGPVRRVRPGTWGCRQVEITNSTPQAVTVVSGGYFSGAPLKRYARKVDLPPQSMRRIQIPVLATANEENLVEWNSMLLSVDDDHETLLHASNDYIIDREELPLASRSESALIGDFDNEHRLATQALTEMIVSMRLATGRNRRTIQIDAGDIPDFHHGLDAVDQIMLGSDHVADFPASLETLRSWVFRGGRLWICLDQTGIAAAQDLFGDQVPLYVIGKTQLVGFHLNNRRIGKSSGDQLQFDYPVDLLQVEVSNVEVIHEVNGWPASFVKTYGQGRVVFTTMGKRAWIRERTDSSSASKHEMNSRYVARPSMVELIDVWHEPAGHLPVDTAEFQTYLSRQVGYSIPSGSIILSILCIFCVALTAVGLWLQTNQSTIENQEPLAQRGYRRPEHIGLFGSILAIGFATPIVLIGQSARNTIPPGTAAVELVRIDPHSSEMHSTGIASVYSPDGDTVTLQTMNGRLVQQPADATSGTLRRLTWTDYGTTIMDGLDLPAGLQFYPTQQRCSLSGPVEAVATFGPLGLHGKFQSEHFLNPGDAVVAGPTEHTLGVSFQADGTFSADAQNTQEPGNYISDAFLSDQQALRQNVFRCVLSQSRVSELSPGPRLLAWTHPAESGLRGLKGYQSSHSSLVEIPLKLVAPPTGTDIVVPSPFVQLELLPSQDGGTTTAYSVRSRRWLESTVKTHLNLQFALPLVLTPLKVSLVNLELRIAAPGRRVGISAGPREDRQLIAELDSPTGTYSYVIDDVGRLQFDAQGRYYVDLAVAPSSTMAGSNDSAWKMDFIRMEVRGRKSSSPDSMDSVKEIAPK